MMKVLLTPVIYMVSSVTFFLKKTLNERNTKIYVLCVKKSKIVTYVFNVMAVTGASD